MNNNTRNITFLVAILFLLTSCLSPRPGNRDSLSYNYSGLVIGIGKTGKDEILKFFGPPTLTDKTALDPDTGRASEAWSYLSLKQKDDVPSMKINGFKFDDKNQLREFVIFEGFFNEELFKKRMAKQEHLGTIKVGRTTKQQIGDTFGLPDFTAIGGPSKNTGAIVECWMYLTKIGEAGGAFIVLVFDENDKVSNQKTISMDDIKNIEKIFDLGK